MSETWAIAIAIVGLVATILSIIFAVSAYYRNKSKDESEVTTRLTKIETDIIYVREKIDKREQWEQSVEERLRAVEKLTAK